MNKEKKKKSSASILGSREKKKKAIVAFLNGRKKLRRYDTKKAKALAVFKKSIHFYETSELQKRTDIVQTGAEQSGYLASGKTF